MNTKEENYKGCKYTVMIIPIGIANGIISGISSVIAAYFFKPLWYKIIKIFHKND